MNRLSIAFVITSIGSSASAQTRSLTTQDYQHAEEFLSYNTNPYIDRGGVNPNWLPGDKFWYRVLTPQGSEFVMVDPVKGTKTAAFDQQKLAAVISKETGKTYTAPMLPFQSFSYSPDGNAIILRAEGKQWIYDLEKKNLSGDT